MQLIGEKGVLTREEFVGVFRRNYYMNFNLESVNKIKME